MDIEQARLYCLSKKATTEGMPFGEGVLVFKVVNKMFALLSLGSTPHTMNLKCDPERAVALRDEWDGVRPGYHMNKKHWNTIELDQLPESLITELIDHSYKLVVKGLKKADREGL